MRWGPGPVFVYECVTSARRWQHYAARSFVVAALLMGIATIALSDEEFPEGNAARQYAWLGESYFYALVGVTLSLVMLAAPAATAGAICLDRARGTLTHILATDLSDAEIVMGKLAARLFPVLGLVACAWPVMAISTLLGGIDPVIVTAAFAVIVAVAILGCSLALALSVWARNPHEVVAVVYMFWAFTLLAYPMMWLLAFMRFAVATPRWLLLSNPYYLAFAPYFAPRSVELQDFVWFVAVSLAASAVCVLAAVWRMRPVSLRVFDRPRKVRKFVVPRRPSRSVPGPFLNINPVLWREWHGRQMSGWVTGLAAFFWCVTTAVCVIAAYVTWAYGMTPYKASIAEVADLIAIVPLILFGLLGLSAVAPMSLSDERHQGSLDMLVVTPLSARSIMLGKWLGTWRLVPRLTIGPGLMMIALATVYDRQMSIGFGVFRAVMMVATILVHGAFITSIGLALSTWIKGQSRAIALSVCAFVLVSVAWPITAYAAASWQNASGLASLSPITAVALLADKGMIRGDLRTFHVWVAFWDVMVAYGALGLLFLTIRSFDRCFGRTPDEIRQTSFGEDVLKFLAGGIAIACVAAAIVAWTNALEFESLSFEALLGLVCAAFIIMIVLSILPAVATFALPVDGSADAPTEVLVHWWRAARYALLLVLGPALFALALATARSTTEIWSSLTFADEGPIFEQLYLGHRLVDVTLLAATICTQGAVVSALSLASYVRSKRRDRAVAHTAGFFLLAATAWPLLIWRVPPAIPVHGLSMLSFLSVSTSLAAELVTREPQYPGLVAWAAVRIGILSLSTIALLWWTIRTLRRRSAQPAVHDQLGHFRSPIPSRPVRTSALVRKVP